MPASAGVYQILCVASGKRYVGSSVNMKTRMRTHRCNLKRGKHHSIHLQRAWSKYGPEAFVATVLELVADATKRVEREQFWMDTHGVTDQSSGYNCLPAAGSALGCKFSYKRRASMSAASKGKTHSAETCALISAALTGRSLSPEHRAKLSAAMKGKPGQPRSFETRAKMSASKKGKTRSPEHCAKLSAAGKGKSRHKRPHSFETRAKISASLKAHYAA